MITFITGKPGSGKSLLAVTTMVELVAAGRTVYALRVRGLNYEATGVKPYPFAPEGHDHPDPRHKVNSETYGLERWRELETGAVLFVDEVQEILKTRGNTGAVPEWIEAFTRNRHYGLDLFFLSQDPMLVDNYVRRLANSHWHLVRPQGFPQMSRLWKWDEFHDDIGKKGAPSLNAEFKVFRYPVQNYALYKSAEVHTVKFKMPQSLKMVIGGGALCLVLVVAGVFAMTRIGKRDDVPPPATAAAPQGAPEAPAATAPGPVAAKTGSFMVSSMDAHTMTQRDWVLQLIPRVEGMPVSAPLYDGVSPSQVPEIYCMSSPDSCTCLSEQGTRIRVGEATCRVIARDGAYNPFRKGQTQG